MNKTKQTVIINGRLYDAATGVPIAKKTPPPPQKEKALKTAVPGKVISDIAAPRPSVVRSARHPAAHAKSQIQKSTTLRRASVKKPASPRRPSAQRPHKNVERSHLVSRFRPANVSPPEHSKTPAAKDAPDPELARQARELEEVHLLRLKRQARAHIKPAISSRAVKEHLLRQSLAKAPLGPHPEVFQAGQMSQKARFTSVATTCVALVLLAGYLTYINIPNLSIRVAAANAGIDATLPRYQPDGFHIQGPIAYSDGQVTVNYQQNKGKGSYSLTQQNSDWDPSAALDNYVEPEAKKDYQIHSIQGLTVYTYDTKAVWVNGGILHVVDGNAPLAGQQVERIAVSM